MKVKSLAVIASLGAPMLIAGAADAAFTGLTTTVDQVNIGGFGDADVVRIYACFDNSADRVTNVFGDPVNLLTIQNGNGTPFYQDAMGGDSGITQSPELIALFPNIAYDSYLDIGMTLSDQGAPVLFTPGFPPPGWGATGDLTTNNGSWIRAIPGDPLTIAGVDGKVFLGQITVQRDAGLSGILNLNTTENGLPGLRFGETFNVPAPGALALLGVAGIVGSSRRRRA